MRVTLTKQQALVANAANPKNETFAFCRVVQIGKGHITAADGFQLVRAPIDYDGDPVYVPVELMPSEACDVAMEHDQVAVITKAGMKTIPHQAAQNYPDTNETWRKCTKRKPKAVVALNVALLRKMLRCIEAKDGGHDTTGIIRFYIRRPSEGVEWHAENGEGQIVVEGVVMPMFVKWGDK